MPRYFFHLTNGAVLEDRQGESLDLLAEARGHAMKVVGELARNQSSSSSFREQSVSVTDEHGVVVFKTKVPD